MPNRPEIANQPSGTRLRGIRSTIRASKRVEADARNAQTPTVFRRSFLREHGRDVASGVRLAWLTRNA